MKSDIEIQKDVIEQLKWEPFLNAAQIGVAVKKWNCYLIRTSRCLLKKNFS